MNLAATLLALLLPAACGYAGWIWLLGRPRDGYAHCAALGAGHLVGSIGFGALLTMCDGCATPTLFAQVAPWMALAAAVALAGAWRWAPSASAASPPAPALSAAQRWLMLGLLVVLGLTLILLVRQAIALPTLPWDAWNAWLAKSKGWYHAGTFVDALAIDAWRNTPHGSAISVAAAFYPEALPRYAVWLASASGGWHDGAVQLAWPAAWLALGLACFGYLGSAGCRAVQALLATTALLLLPLLTAHAALGGYADLWLAAMLMLSGLHLIRGWKTRAWRELVAAAACAMLLPMLKLEGAVWLACGLVAVLLASLPRRWRWALLLAGPLLWAIAMPFGGLRLPLPGIGVVRFGWGVIDLPTHGAMQLAWRPVLDEVIQALWLLPNWSLLWYVAPLVIALRWRRLRTARELVPVAWWLGFGYAFLLVLFFLTDASAWAENLTSVNRVLMHVVPLTVAWLSLLWAAQSTTDTARPTVG